MRNGGQLKNGQEGSPSDDMSLIPRVMPEDRSAAPGNPLQVVEMFD